MDDAMQLMYDRIKDNTARITDNEQLARETDKSMAILIENQRHYQEALGQLAESLKAISASVKALEATAQRQEGALRVVRFLFDKKTLIGGGLAYASYLFANSPLFSHLIN